MTKLQVNIAVEHVERVKAHSIPVKLLQSNVRVQYLNMYQKTDGNLYLYN